MRKLKIIMILTIIFNSYAFGAYLKNVPITITQPNGVKIACFATGDEFYNWVHDTNGYTIIQDGITGYYCYAILSGDSLIASQYVVGMDSPASVRSLQPYTNISGEKIMEKVKASPLYMEARSATQESASRGGVITGTMNNIVIYVRFTNDTEFPPQQALYTSMFNSTSSGANSMRNYFNEATYGNLDIVSYFFPINDGVNIISYQDTFPRAYYCKHNDITNPIGYENKLVGNYRLKQLLINVVNFVKNQIDTSLNVDYNNDKRTDNICLIIQGKPEGWSDVLWPHQGWIENSYNLIINGTTVGDYTLQIEEMLVDIQSHQPIGTGVLCHEMGHVLGFPDLYHYNDDGVPVGHWDLMAHDQNPPQHMGAYMKYRYGGWINSIPSITTHGNYTLNSLVSSTNNCYKIPIKNSSQYLVLEYRKKTGIFESSLPSSGLIIYRIDEMHTGKSKGNSKGVGHGGKKNDEVYIFRPDGTTSSDGYTDSANFSQNVGRTAFSNFTNPYGFYIVNDSMESFINIRIKNIQEHSNGTLTFYVGFCENDTIIYSNTNNLPIFTNASCIETLGTVTVKSTDNIIFEIGEEVILNLGFKVELGGTFRIDINGCANQK